MPISSILVFNAFAAAAALAPRGTVADATLPLPSVIATMCDAVGFAGTELTAAVAVAPTPLLPVERVCMPPLKSVWIPISRYALATPFK